MNWPFEIKYPVAVSSDDWVRDAEGRTIIEAHMADEFNALHAEVERLWETQRKLAEAVSLSEEIHEIESSFDFKARGFTLPERDVYEFKIERLSTLLADPLVAAAIAEVKGAKSERL